MASTHIQRECEKWIVAIWLPDQYEGVNFSNKSLPMQDTTGRFKFDAVSADQKIVGNISTATAHTHRNTLASGKKSKLRADCLMLALCSAETKLMILTEECMYKLAKHEQANGRLPLDIDIRHVTLPEVLQQKLLSARETASKEVRSNSQPGTAGDGLMTNGQQRQLQQRRQQPAPER